VVKSNCMKIKLLGLLRKTNNSHSGKQTTNLSLLYIDDKILPFFKMIEQARGLFGLPFFMEIFSVAAGEIWKERNGKIFRGQDPAFTF
jgi:hypothetical protein